MVDRAGKRGTGDQVHGCAPCVSWGTVTMACEFLRLVEPLRQGAVGVRVRRGPKVQ